MKAVDTNVLLRFLVRDDDEQAAVAAAFFSKRTAEDPAFVSLIGLDAQARVSIPAGYGERQSRSASRNRGTCL